MGTVVLVVLGLWLVCGVAWTLVTTAREIGAREAYQKALAELTQDPLDLELRRKALELGRVYSARTKNAKGECTFGEATLMNDIHVACLSLSGGQKGAALTPLPKAPAVDGSRVAGTEKGLDDLLAAGILTADEFERAQALCRQAPPAAEAVIVRLLRDLRELLDHGVIGGTEFSTKKQDVLSGRVLRRR